MMAGYDQYERLEQDTVMKDALDETSTEPLPALPRPKPPRPRSIEERPLPEDWALRGLLYTQHTFPQDWFGAETVMDDGERLMEKAAMKPIRQERILWLADPDRPLCDVDSLRRRDCTSSR